MLALEQNPVTPPEKLLTEKLLTDFLIHILANNKLDGQFSVPANLTVNEAEWLVSSLEKLLEEHFISVNFKLTESLSLFPADAELSEEQKDINERFLAICEKLNEIDKVEKKMPDRKFLGDYTSQKIKLMREIHDDTFVPTLHQLCRISIQKSFRIPYHESRISNEIAPGDAFGSVSQIKREIFPSTPFKTNFLSCLIAHYRNHDEFKNPAPAMSLLQIFCRYGHERSDGVFERLLERYDHTQIISTPNRLPCPFILASEFLCPDYFKKLLGRVVDKKDVIGKSQFDALIKKSVTAAYHNKIASVEIQTILTLSNSRELNGYSPVEFAQIAVSTDQQFRRSMQLQNIYRMCSFSCIEWGGGFALAFFTFSAMALSSQIPDTQKNYMYALGGLFIAFLLAIIKKLSIPLPYDCDPSLPRINVDRNFENYGTMGSTVAGDTVIDILSAESGAESDSGIEPLAIKDLKLDSEEEEDKPLLSPRLG